MKRLVSALLTLFSFACLLVAMERRALAYTDPGTGLLAIQSITSVLAAAGFFLRRRIGTFFDRKREASVTLPVANEKGDTPKIA